MQQTRSVSDRQGCIDETILNTIHNLNVAVKSNENDNFKMLPQVINFKLLTFLTVFKFSEAIK